MAIPYIKINEVLKKWAANALPIVDFTVENVLAAAGLESSDYEGVLRYLMSKRDFELIPMKMILCPFNHKIDTVSLDEPIDEDEEFLCWSCSEEYNYNPKKVLLVFNFTEEFKTEAIKKKNILSQQHLALV